MSIWQGTGGAIVQGAGGSISECDTCPCEACSCPPGLELEYDLYWSGDLGHHTLVLTTPTAHPGVLPGCYYTDTGDDDTAFFRLGRLPAAPFNCAWQVGIGVSAVGVRTVETDLPEGTYDMSDAETAIISIPP